MARPKKVVEALTPEAQDFAFIATHATSSDRISWNRKHNNLQAVLDQIQPLEDQMQVITGKLLPLYDEIAQIRKIMVEECIHPTEMLSHKGSHVECKFCLKNIVITRN